MIYAKTTALLLSGILLLGFTTSLASGSQSPAPQDGIAAADLGKRVASLEKELGAAKDTIQGLEKRMQAMDAWFQKLPGACAALDAKMDEARKAGFEFAGPNPKAKAAVLDGVKSFAGTLKATPEDAAKAAKKDDKPARSNGRTLRRKASR